LRFLARRRALEFENNVLRGRAQRRLAAQRKRAPGDAPDRAFKRIDEIRRHAPPETKAQRSETRQRTQSLERRLIGDTDLDQHLRRCAPEARQRRKRGEI